MSNVERAIGVMDRLYSPGGCPWDREQTHVSLVPYLLEEAHELAEAIETGDRAAMREELGDVLLQVLFHARIAQDELESFDLQDVAGDLADKLVRRHPHVFAGQEISGDLHAQWDLIKKQEKQRTSVLEGIALNQGALARAQKVLARAERAGVPTQAPVAGTPGGPGADAPGEPGEPGADAARGCVANPSGDVGQELLALVRRAHVQGVDAEAALRTALRDVEHQIAQAEQAMAPAANGSPSNAQ